MLNNKNTVLVIVDVQGKLAHMMHNKENLFQNLQRIIKGATILNIPILWTEQNPKGLGPTIPEIGELLSHLEPISKCCFSCYESPLFIEQLKALPSKHVLMTGIETHICVYQTAMDLLETGKYEVQVIADAVSSRNPENKEIGLQKLRDKGAAVTCVETVLYEILRSSEHPSFKKILQVVK